MLRWIKRILLLLIILAAVILGFKFSIDNGQPVQLLFFGWQLPDIPLGVWVLCALLLGYLLGLLLSFVPNAFNRRSLTMKDNKIQRLEAQLQKVREDSKA